jgi:hypothetical protein
MRADGSITKREYTARGRSRLTINVNEVLPDSSVGARITSDEPVVVERSSYFNDGRSGTNSIGIAR